MTAKVKGIQSLIDRGHYLDKNVKIMSKELDGIKVKIRQHAKATQKGQHAGVKSKVLVSPSSTSYIDPMKVWVALGRSIRTFKHVVKIIKGQLNGYISEPDIIAISKTFSSTRDMILDSYLDGEITKKEMKNILTWCNKMEKSKIDEALRSQ